MTPRQLFRVVAATLGLWYLLQGLMLLLDALMIAIHLTKQPEQFTMQSYAVRGAFGAFVGFFVMCGLPAFDRMAFPRHHKEANGGGSATDEESSSSK